MQNVSMFGYYTTTRVHQVGQREQLGDRREIALNGWNRSRETLGR